MLKSFNKIIVHHSGELDLPRLDFFAAWNWQVRKKKWAWLGYHAFVELYQDLAVVVPGRPLNREGAHCRGQNQQALGICFAGNWNESPFQQTMIYDLFWTGATQMAAWLAFFSISPTEIYPHSDFAKTDCPGKYFPLDYLKELTKRFFEERYKR